VKKCICWCLSIIDTKNKLCIKLVYLYTILMKKLYIFSNKTLFFQQEFLTFLRFNVKINISGLFVLCVDSIAYRGPLISHQILQPRVTVSCVRTLDVKCRKMDGKFRCW